MQGPRERERRREEAKVGGILQREFEKRKRRSGPLGTYRGEVSEVVEVNAFFYSSRKTIEE